MNSNDRKGKQQMTSEELYAYEKASVRSAKLNKLIEEAKKLGLSEKEFKANIFSDTMSNEIGDNNVEDTLPSMNHQNPFYQENVNKPFSDPMDTVQPEFSFSGLMEPSYQNSLSNIPELSSQPDFSIQPKFTLPSELLEIFNKEPSKWPMPDFSVQHQPPCDKVQEDVTQVLIPYYHEKPPSRLLHPHEDMMKTFSTFPEHGPWFAWHLKDSLAFIHNAESEEENPLPFKEKYVNTSTPKVRRYSQIRKPANRNTKLVVYGKKFDITKLPKPFCTCTGTPRTCDYTKGTGWTSVCCTSYMSIYPLPLNTSGSQTRRLVGRRMGYGTYAKVIEQMDTAGHDFNYPIDLKEHWCKHGSNNNVRKY